MGGSCSFSKKSAGTTTNIIKLSNTNRNNNSNRQSQSNVHLFIIYKEKPSYRTANRKQ